MSTGENIRYYRKKAGLTQKALAGESNLAEITIRKYETDSTQPNFNSCIAVAKALNITEQDLFAETPLTLGEKIKKARNDKGLTQEQLADKIGKTESSIRKYEAGLVEIPFSVIRQISEKLEIEFNYLVTEDEKKEPIPKKETNLADMTIFDLHMLITNASVELAKRAAINDRRR